MASGEESQITYWFNNVYRWALRCTVIIALSISSVHAESSSWSKNKQFVVRKGLVPHNKVYCTEDSTTAAQLYFLDRGKKTLLIKYILRLKRGALRLKVTTERRRRNILISKLERILRTYTPQCQNKSGTGGQTPHSPEVTPTPRPSPSRSPSPSPTPSPIETNRGPPVVLPIEVMGPNNTTKSASLYLTRDEAQQASNVYLRIHNLTYEGKVSVAINGRPYVSINNANVTIEPLAARYGGIGGGFTTIKILLPLAANTLKEGNNTFSFKFNFSDGISSGFRIIELNLIDANNAPLIRDSRITIDDPTLWKPALSTINDIESGKSLWMNARLFDPGAGKMIQARCQHCHATDGSDLKYFNFSDYAIIARSEFHGLSAQEGKLIAAYIRSLPGVSPGRPWNPPFQPGPGIDKKPVEEWSAGAGVDAVLNRDEEMLTYIFPKGIRTDEARPESNVKAREIPVAFQLPDWNGWLPTVHPIDGFGEDAVPGIVDSNCATAPSDLAQASHCGYLRLIEGLEKKKARNGVLTLLDFAPNTWSYYTGKTLRERVPPPALESDWSTFDAHRYYSIPQFLMVKQWEILRHYNLEGTAPTLLDPTLRRWVGGQAFATSPRMVGIPRDKISIRNNSKLLHTYLGWVWYHLQLILNDGNRSQSANAPIDWGYSYGHIKDLGNSIGHGQLGLMTLWNIKGLQLKNATTPADGVSKWGLRTGLGTLYDVPFTKVFYNVPLPTLQKVLTALTTSLIDELQLYPVESYYTPVSGAAVASPEPPGPLGPDLANNLWVSIPKAKFIGVAPDTISKMIQFAERLFPPPPGYQWRDLLNTNCNWVYPGAQEELSFKRYLVKCDSEVIFR